MRPRGAWGHYERGGACQRFCSRRCSWPFSVNLFFGFIFVVYMLGHRSDERVRSCLCVFWSCIKLGSDRYLVIRNSMVNNEFLFKTKWELQVRRPL